MKFFYTILTLLMLANASSAQEINFSRIQDMATWYNQSLKTDKFNTVRFNMRSVRYDGMMAYKTVAAMVDVPIIVGGKTEDHSGYLSLSAGASSDKSNENILSNTTGLLGISYAVPIGADETYVSVGVQGTYYQSRLNITPGVTFGDQYDAYGPITGMQSSDRYATGWAYNNMNVNAGISVFSNAENNKWYLGASVMHINKAFTDDIKSDENRLNRLYSFQGGYKYVTEEKDYCAFYATMNWQGKAYKHFFNLSYSKALPDVDAAVGVGLGYRFNDALIPNVELRYSKINLSLGYDVNVSDFNIAGYKRNGLELSLKIDF
jgi:type IX secretion system PorP/SprF family membrane protein